MDCFVSENVQELLEKYRFDIDPSSPSEDLTCTICHKLIRDVYESFCGCTFCRDCVSTLASKGDQYCPGEHKDCMKRPLCLDRNVFRSAKLNERISTVRVLCPNQFCVYGDDLENMANHLKHCTEKQIECPLKDLGCGYNGMSREMMQGHMNIDILAHGQLLMKWFNQFRRAFDDSQSEKNSAPAMFKPNEELNEEICFLKNELKALREEIGNGQENGKGLTAELIKSHKKEMDDLQNEMYNIKNDIQNKGKERDEEIYLLKQEVATTNKRMKETEMKINKQHAEIATLKANLHIANTQVNKQNKEMDELKTKLKDAEVNLNTQSIDIRSLKMRMAEETMQVNKQNKEMDELKTKLKDAEANLNTQRIDMRSLKMRMSEETKPPQKSGNDFHSINKGMMGTEINISKLQSEIASLRTNVNDVKTSGDTSRAVIDGLLKTAAMINLRTNMTGEIFFPISTFETLRTTVNYLVSPYFYSHANGYKLQLRVYPGGTRDGRGTHLSVYIQICKGEYDDSLSWPLKHTITITIVDQQRPGAIHNSVTISYDTTPQNLRYSFLKPLNMDNIGHGRPTFISHSDLCSINGLVVDNRIVIKCTVTPPSE